MHRRMTWCWVEITSTQHLLPISTLYSDEKYGSDISLTGAYQDFISQLLKESRSYGRCSWLNHGKPILACHDSPLSVHAMMDAGWNSPCITVWGVVLLLPENGHDWVHRSYYISSLKNSIGLYRSTKKFPLEFYWRNGDNRSCACYNIYGVGNLADNWIYSRRRPHVLN